MKSPLSIIQLAVLLLVIPSAAGGWWCKAFWGVACPLGVSLATSGTGAAVGVAYCGLNTISRCRKRTLETAMDGTDMKGMEEYAFPDEFSDFDTNGDNEIEYEEFAFTLMKLFSMSKPEEIRKPFSDADKNDDGRIDEDEFKKAPFLFAHPVKGEISELKVDPAQVKRYIRKR